MSTIDHPGTGGTGVVPSNVGSSISTVRPPHHKLGVKTIGVVAVRSPSASGPVSPGKNSSNARLTAAGARSHVCPRRELPVIYTNIVPPGAVSVFTALEASPSIMSCLAAIAFSVTAIGPSTGPTSFLVVV